MAASISPANHLPFVHNLTHSHIMHNLTLHLKQHLPFTCCLPHVHITILFSVNKTSKFFMNIFLIKINIQQNKCFVSIELYLVHPKMYMFQRIVSIIFFSYISLFFIFNNVIPSFAILYLILR